MKFKKQINTEVIKALNPCLYRFNNWLLHYKDWKGDILEFLELDLITAKDKIWVSIRVLPRELLEYFAIDCAFSAQSYAYAAAAYAYAAAAYAAYAAEYENQIDALIMIIEMNSHD